ncbi:MAG TPA: flagellar hook-length control protein FliK [Alcaligenes sp.]|nr:flagellar hook-length control protein FliK [Alcaligenes sp.]HRL25957.1 flagellar hook-length control protein FliK [Alcaligenes sp.]
MSIGGPSPLGTLLIQRLDAVLGIGTSQQSNIANGARPDAISQTPGSTRVERPENNPGRDPRQSVDHVRAQSQHQTSTPQRTQHGRVPVDPALLNSGPNTASTPSAPTTLGRTAQFILALLERFPDRAPPVQGRQALLPGEPETAPSPRPAADTSGSARPGQTPAQTGGSLAQTLAQQRLPLPAGGSPTSGIAPPGAQSPTLQGSEAGAALTRHFAQALPHALQHSGLFYESHLSDLHFGQRNAAQLQQEPQNALPRPAAASEQTAPAPSSTTSTAQATQSDQPQALLVRQQLDVLANQTIQWQGQAWPQTDMDWTVQRHESSSADEPEHWSSTLHLNLPTLGPVTLRLNLLDQQLLVSIQAGQSAPYLDEHSMPLRERLQEQGLHLSQLHIQADAPDEMDTAHHAG